MGSSHIVTPKGTYLCRSMTYRLLVSSNHFCTANPFTSPQNPMFCNGLDISLSVPSRWIICTPSDTRLLRKWIHNFSCFCTAHGRASLYFTTRLHFPPKIAPSHGGIWTPSNTVPWAHPSPQPKRHLDRLSRFCRAHNCDRLTDHITRSVTIGRIYVHSTAMRPNNVNHTAKNAINHKKLPPGFASIRDICVLDRHTTCSGTSE